MELLTIEEATDRIIDYRGKTPPKTTSGVPLITAKVIKGGTILEEPREYIAADYYDAWMRRGLPEQHDVLITTEAPLGEVAMLKTTDRIALAQRVILLRAKKNRVDPHYMFYALQGQFTQGELRARSSGTTVAGIKQSELRQVRLYLPPLAEQRRIAGILSAYDDLIENCQRRIRILEEMARRLYREWFVHYRYPGHESIPFVPCPLGPIPQGWEIQTVAESFEIMGGGTPSKTEAAYWDGGEIQWYSPRDLTAAGTMFIDDSVGHITRLGLAKSSARMFPAESVMLTSRATIGAVAINTQPACTNQGFITCLPNARMPLFYLYHWVTENVEQFDRLATGATFKEISRGVFKTIDVLRPKESVVCRFEELVEPACRQSLNLQRQSANLRRTRDLLLPRLLAKSSPLNRG